MGRYRTRLILAAPEFDTYDSVRRYAAHQNSAEAIMALEATLKRVEQHLIWDTSTRAKAKDQVDSILKARIGKYKQEDDSNYSTDLDSMTPEAAEDLYKNALKAVGMEDVLDRIGSVGA